VFAVAGVLAPASAPSLPTNIPAAVDVLAFLASLLLLASLL
jgi:hypothetical protein